MKITRVSAGEGQTAQTASALSQIRQNLTVGSPFRTENTATLPVTLAAGLAETAYTLRELGVYARDPSEGEILYKIYRLAEPVDISPDSRLVLRFYLEESVSQDVNAVVACSPAGLLTEADFAPVRDTVLQKARAGKRYTMPVTELQAFLNNMPRMIMDGYTFTVSGTLEEPLVIANFCGCGSIHIKAEERGGCTFTKGIRISSNTCETVTLQNLVFSNPDAADHNACEIQAGGFQNLYLFNCDFSGNQKGTAIEVGNGTTATALNCTIKRYMYVALTMYNSILVVSCEKEDDTENNICGARTYFGGIIQMGLYTNPTLGGTYFNKGGGLIVKPNNTVA